MGSPLGPVFRDFYMGHIENKIFTDNKNKPFICARYVYDIFVLCHDTTELLKIKQKTIPP